MFQDLKLTIRSLLKAPGLTATVLATLALCIGANTAIFSMLYALAIKPLPFRDPERIVQVYNLYPKLWGPNKMHSSVAQYLDFKEHAPGFAQLGLWRLSESTLGEESQPVRVTAANATADMFDVLGLRPLIGRFFTAKNQVPGANKVLVLTQACWESRFQADPGVLGKTLRLDGETYEIVGVAPVEFQILDARIQFVRPVAWPPSLAEPYYRYGLGLQLYGRLKAGVTLDEAQAQLAALEQRYYDTAPPDIREYLDRSGHTLGIDSLHARRLERIKTALYLLEGVALFVLLIGCVNVANLLLARSNARYAEFAIRVSLGSSRWAIARQLLVESALLVWCGAALGLLLTWAALNAVNHSTGRLMPNMPAFAVDGGMLVCTVAVAGAVSLIVGMFPVVQMLRDNLHRSMQLQSRAASAGHGVRKISGALVVVQTAAALMLLIGAGLLIRSFAKVLAVDPGFDPRQVISARVALPVSYAQENRAQLFQRRLQAALEEVPGFTAALATATPFQTGGLATGTLTPGTYITTFTLRDYKQPKSGKQPGVFYVGASPSYLTALRVPLRQGRWFKDGDTNESRKVYVVDETFAKLYFPHGDAVGQHLNLGGPPEKVDDWPEIIGVVGDVRHNGVEENSGNPLLYLPLTQSDFSYVRYLSVFVRTARSVPETLGLLRAKVAALDPALPVFQAEPMEEVVSDSFEYRRSIMALFGSFAALALLLSAVGIYGVLAYDVSRRTHEIGIRGALGATGTQIVLLVLKQGLWKAALGLLIGLAGATALSRFMTGLLYEVKPTDPQVYLLVPPLLLAVALLASYLPARRATKVDPLVTLRAE